MGRLVLLLLMMMACHSDKENTGNLSSTNSMEATFYLGTYTDGESQGIYKYTINEKGILKNVGLAAVSDNPSFLCYTSDKKYILAANEIDSKEGSGTVESYKINKDKLELISRSSSGGAHTCFVTCNSKGTVLAANYTGGNVGLLNVDSNGKLSDLLDIQQHSGKGTTERQEGPHAHSVWFVPNSNDVMSVDLGTNQIWFSSIGESLDKFVPVKQKTLNFANGAGPRHLTFHPNGKWTYVLNELTGSVSLLRKNIDGDFEILSTVSSLDPAFKGFNKSADIHESPLNPLEVRCPEIFLLLLIKNT